MIRVVCDTNVIISASLQPLGPSAQLFVLAIGGAVQLCVTGNIYAEYEEVIRRPRFQRSEETIVKTLQAIREKGLWLRPTEPVRVCADPDHDIFLECAQAARADYLVTGNLKHFPAVWEGTRIVTPRWLADTLSSENLVDVFLRTHISPDRPIRASDMETVWGITTEMPTHSSLIP